jgi:hypothetical protein
LTSQGKDGSSKQILAAWQLRSCLVLISRQSALAQFAEACCHMINEPA